MAVSATSGGGLDVETIVSQLMTLEKRPLTALDKQISKKNDNAGYLSTFKTKVVAFEASLAALRDSSKVAGMTTSSSDAAAVTATSTTGATAGDIEVKVVTTAQADKVAFSGFTSATDTPGAGTFSLSIGDKTVSIDTDGLDLTKIVAKFNETAVINIAPLKASLVQTSSGAWSMVVTGTETGLAKQITSSVASTTALLDAGAMVEIQPARDALVYVDGMAVTSASNTINNVVPGVVLQLRKPVDSTLPNASTVMISVAQNSADIRKLADSVVTSFNEMQDFYMALTKTSVDSTQRGPLSGDSSLAAMMNRTRALLADGMVDADKKVFRFADMGIELTSTGKLKMNEANFSSAMNNGLSAKLAAGVTIELDTYLGKMVLSTGELGIKQESLSVSQAALEKRKSELSDRLSLVESSLRARYAALDATLYRLNNINTSLTSALDALANKNN